MYIKINDIKGEKTIDLSYPIHPMKEITVIIMLSNNIQYNILKLHSVMGPPGPGPPWILFQTQKR